MSARSLGIGTTVAKSLPTKRTRRPKRLGKVTESERTLVKNVMAENPGDPPIRALAQVLHRSEEVVRKVVSDVRLEFAESAKDYLDYHKEGVRKAIHETGNDPKGLDAGIRGAQWALENISLGGSRVVDAKAQKSDGGTKVFIGIKVGGMNPGETQPNAPVEAEVTDVKEVVS